MKVQYKKDYTDEFGMFFPAGCVAEHSETDGAARIALGVCEVTDPEARARVQPLTSAVSTECAPEPEPDIQTQPKHKHK